MVIRRTSCANRGAEPPASLNARPAGETEGAARAPGKMQEAPAIADGIAVEGDGPGPGSLS